jgi:hypothetical protein
MVIAIHALVVIAGLCLYGLCNGKASEVGRIMFMCSFLVIMLRMSGDHVRLF